MTGNLALKADPANPSHPAGRAGRPLEPALDKESVLAKVRI